MSGSSTAAYFLSFFMVCFRHSLTSSLRLAFISNETQETNDLEPEELIKHSIIPEKSKFLG